METSSDFQVKQQVRQFYDQVGWQEVGEGVYQNARFEDLRPVSQEYIHNCHLRVRRHLKPEGKYFLDAGSGPIQYPEYLDYSKGYQARVCADISIVALKEARQRIGDRKDDGQGLFVVADVANLPFTDQAFDGVVSLHTIHHLPSSEHQRAFLELFRVLGESRSAVVVNGWESSSISDFFVAPIKWGRRTKRRITRRLSNKSQGPAAPRTSTVSTFVNKQNANWLKMEVGRLVQLEIYVWRTVSVRFLKAYIHPHLGGRWLLRQLYRLEERFPEYMGENGLYPLIVLKKS
ncbi:MAG: class I SAM-dependent methyltransferase [Anaerolineales bacterium]